MLAAKSIKYSYNSNNKFNFRFCLESTEDLLIIGDSELENNFSNILGGLLSPQSGSITLNGTNYSDLSNRFRQV